MDKNLVNVDDLVRKRLSGGEEKEREGAWGNMRDLLDKEMPQEKKVGFLYWRRMFSVAAALLLAATAGIGSYELYMANKADTELAIADASMNKSNDAVAKNNDMARTFQVSADVADASKDAVPAINAADARPVNDKARRKPLPANSTNMAKAVADNDKTSTHSNDAVLKDKLTQGHTAANRKDLSAAATKNTIKVVSGTSNNNVRPNTEKALTGIAKKVNTDIAPVQPGNATAKDQDNSRLQPSNIALTTKNESNIPATTGIANNVPVTANKNMSADKLPAGNTANMDASKIAKTDPVRFAALAAMPAMPAGKLNDRTIGTDLDHANLNASGTAMNRTGAKGIAVNPMNPMSTDNNAQPSAPGARKGKKIIEKMVLHEHYIRTAPGEGYYKLDTISIETLTEELKSERPGTNSNTNAPRGTGKKTSAVTTGKNIAGEEEGTDIEVFNSSSYTGSAAKLNKVHANAKKATGISMVERLSAAFNDVKYTASGAQFVPGITAGINGTFFGPNTFKGFQFGVTGNLIINDQWNIMAELKYFQRLNGNSSVEDNYYKYTPTGTAQFRKELMLSAYSFSALHSLEIPFSVRYAMGNFNFFFGGNVIYDFALNTGASMPLSGGAPTTVNEIGADNGPQLAASDFKSRLGIGYLFGLSYQVAPNVCIDIRNVQTMFDNAASAGAKKVSSDLYKSPSLQVSVGYRFGGRNKE